MVAVPMTVDYNTIRLAIYYLQKVTPAGHQEQEQLFGVISRLQAAGQSSLAFSTGSNHSHSGATSS